MKNISVPLPNAMSRGIGVHIAAQRIGCSRRTVRRWVAQRKLTAYRLGRRSWLVLSTDVEIARVRWGSVW